MVYIVENTAVNGGALAIGHDKKFDLQIKDRWCKITYIKIVQLTPGPMVVGFDIWEKGGAEVDPTSRPKLLYRILRRYIKMDAADGAEYGEAISTLIPYKDRDDPGESNVNHLHCRIENLVGGVASDFAVSVKIADISEVV